MIQFNDIDSNEFLKNYWQKKPLVFRNAFGNTHNLISGDELAGLALDDHLESRIVIEDNQNWQLKQGPFEESIFSELPKTHWALLVNGVDRVIPEIAALLDQFNFIPRWRFNDVMISYAAKHGNVGPHFDNYDVFLYQAEGSREWSLTSKNCTEKNSIENQPLRHMKEFDIEETFVLEPGDMLYLPPHIGHHGVATTDDCITYSFGCRSYPVTELFDDFTQTLIDNGDPELYIDPNWNELKSPSEISQTAVEKAQQTLINSLSDAKLMNDWFGKYVTSIDLHTEHYFHQAARDNDESSQNEFYQLLTSSEFLLRDNHCRMAWMQNNDNAKLFINGQAHLFNTVDSALIQAIADNTQLKLSDYNNLLNSDTNKLFIFELWLNGYLYFDAESHNNS